MKTIKEIIYNYLDKDLNNIELLNMYYEIGKTISENEINILDLEIYLKSIFGLVISFSRRNLRNMIKLYKKYSKNDLINLEQYKWIQIIEILNNKKVNEYIKDESLIELKKIKNML